MRRLIFLFVMLATVASAAVFPFSLWNKASRQIYFGNCTSAGAVPVAWNGTDYDFFGGAGLTFFGADGGTQDFVCPGSGIQAINSVGVYAKSRSGSINTRVAVYGYTDEGAPPNAAIYDSTLVLMGSGAVVSFSNTVSGQWQSSSTITTVTALTGGKHYKISPTTNDGSLFSYAYMSGSNSMKYVQTDYTGGFPTNISSGNTWSENLLTRVQITGNGTAVAAAYERYYVDPSYGGGGSTGSSAKPYTSLNAAIAARCNKTFVLPIQIVCRTSSSTADTTRVDIGALGQFVTSSSNYLEIMADAGQEAGTSWDATKYHLEVPYASSTGTAMNIPANYVRIENLQIGISGPQTSTSEIVYWSGLDLRMSGSIIRGAYSSTQVTRCMSVSTNTSTVKLWNDIFYGIGANTGGATALLQSHGNVDVYSCTFVGLGWNGVNNASDGVMRMVNCYSGGSINLCLSDESAGNFTMSYTISSDSTATGTGSQTGKAVNTTQFTNVTPTTENFSLPGAGSALYQSGTDTSGTAAPLNFTTAIGGGTRTSPWSVGAANN